MKNKKDFIIKVTRKWYCYSCNNCGIDRGYLHRDNSGLCRSCAKQRQRLLQVQDSYPNVNFNNSKIINKKIHYQVDCPICNKCKGYIHTKSRWSTPCRSCNGSLQGSKNSKNKKAWNRGIVGVSEETRIKMSMAKKGKVPPNKGIPMSQKQKVKLSCSSRNIPISEFNGFSMTEQKRQRSIFDKSLIRTECFEKANYKCDIYTTNDRLNAHHLNSWHSNEEERFNIDNLVCLSEAAHKTFHHLYGNKNNTKEQYYEFKALMTARMKIRQDLYFLIGAPASGKSWVANQLIDQFNYVSYDNINKNYHIYKLLMANDKTLLFDPTFKISTIIRRYGHLFNIKIICIQETEEILKARLGSRGGKWTDTVMKRNTQVRKRYEKYGNNGFMGSSREALEFLKESPT